MFSKGLYFLQKRVRMWEKLTLTYKQSAVCTESILSGEKPLGANLYTSLYASISSSSLRKCAQTMTTEIRLAITVEYIMR